MRPISLAAGVLLATSVLAGCGSDDPDDTDGTGKPDDTTSSAGTPTGTASDAGPGSCGTSLRATWPDGTETVLDGEAQAAVLGDGTAYTLYAGDYDVPEQGIGTDTILPPAGSRLAVVFLTAFNATSPLDPITPGTTVEVTEEFDVLTFSAILYDGESAAQSSLGAAGELSVVAVDDDSICVDVTYEDDEKSLAGQISATVHHSPY